MSAKEPSQESRMLYAVAWYHSERNSSTPLSISHIACACEVPNSTLKHRIKGRKRVNEVAESRLKLTMGEEAAIVANCRILSSWLQAPRVSLVSEMALGLLRKRELPPQSGSSHLGENWVYEFLQRHPELSSKYSKQIEHCCVLKLRNPPVLMMYFDTVSIIKISFNF